MLRRESIFQLFSTFTHGFYYYNTNPIMFTIIFFNYNKYLRIVFSICVVNNIFSLLQYKLQLFILKLALKLKKKNQIYFSTESLTSGEFKSPCPLIYAFISHYIPATKYKNYLHFAENLISRCSKYIQFILERFELIFLKILSKIIIVTTQYSIAK